MMGRGGYEARSYARVMFLNCAGFAINFEYVFVGADSRLLPDAPLDQHAQAVSLTALIKRAVRPYVTWYLTRNRKCR